MITKLQSGQQVTVNAFGGKRPSVIVVEDRGDVVLVCGDREFENAKAEKREPITIGIGREDIIDTDVPHRKTMSSEESRFDRRSQAGD